MMTTTTLTTQGPNAQRLQQECNPQRQRQRRPCQSPWQRRGTRARPPSMSMPLSVMMVMTLSFSLLLLLLLLSSSGTLGMVSNQHGHKTAYNKNMPIKLTKPEGQKARHFPSQYFTRKSKLPPLKPLQTTDTTDIPDFLQRSIPLVYTNDPKTVCQWLQENLPMDGCVVGFDVETAPNQPWAKPAFPGPAVVQLATMNSCLVVHLAHLLYLCPSTWEGENNKNHEEDFEPFYFCQRIRDCAPILKSVLCDEQYIKVGSAIDDDMLDLYDIWDGLHAQSRLDLGGIGQPSMSEESLVSSSPSQDSQQPQIHQRMGLKALCETILGLEMPKSKKIQISDWSRVPLTRKQQMYGARDAWVAVAVATTLANHDPQTFGHAALVKLLQSQTPLSEVIQRRQAIDELSHLLQPYSDLNPPTSCSAKIKKQQRKYDMTRKQRKRLKSTKVLLTSSLPSSLPKGLHGKVNYLRRVIQQSNPKDDPPPFEVDHLGFDVQRKKP